MKIEFPSQTQIPGLKKLWAESFGDSEEFIDHFFAAGFSPDMCRCFLDGQTVAAALYWFDASYRGQKLAYLYAVATAPGYRGRGLCRSLMADTHDLLRQRGYAAALLLPGEPGLRRMYEAMGYRDCCQVAEVTCEVGEAVPLTEIQWGEYAGLRPSFLPEDGAVQDGLAFLSTYAWFYRGEDFLLAASRGEDRLVGLELLGNPKAAPGILAALESPKGTFRCPGKGKPGSMALPLRTDAVCPRYFGLTFD